MLDDASLAALPGPRPRGGYGARTSRALEAERPSREVKRMIWIAVAVVVAGLLIATMQEPAEKRAVDAPPDAELLSSEPGTKDER
jgi:hypothetical protein